MNILKIEIYFISYQSQRYLII